ncbi:MAG: hypothetical protein JSR79_03030 [Proteobacteria bacterium]|nr:hypothetical protein [Pseudomonadota bacterium]
MGSMKGAGALIAALVPIAYCGAMVHYFFSVGGGSLQGVNAMGLGPTVLGLGALGLLFLVPLLVRLIRLGTPPRPGAVRRASHANMPVEKEAFDAEAALARYMARKAKAGEEVPAAAMVVPDSPAATPARPTFGRKIS